MGGREEENKEKRKVTRVERDRCAPQLVICSCFFFRSTHAPIHDLQTNITGTQWGKSTIRGDKESGGMLMCGIVSISSQDA